MSFAHIQSALIKAYKDAGFGVPTAEPNREFDADKSALWAELFIVPSDTSVASLGDAGTDGHIGFMQINLHVPYGSGRFAVLSKADEIRAVFKSGSDHSFNGVVVTIEKTRIERPLVANGTYTQPITIYYYTRTPR